MDKKEIILCSAFFLILIFGLSNHAEAHDYSPNDSIPAKRADYVDPAIDVKCNDPDWQTWSGGSLQGDQDNDSICDAWENVSGYLDINFKQVSTGHQYRYKIACSGADCPSPTKRDLYVELDWMRDNQTPDSHSPLATAITDLKAAFNSAPYLDVNNNGVQDANEGGVNLHIQNGEDSRLSIANQGEINFHYNALRVPGTDLLPGFYAVKTNYFGTSQERTCTSGYESNPNCTQNISYPNSIIKDRLTAKRQVFHYGLIINEQYGNTFSGWSEQNGNDFVMSLGSFVPDMGSTDQQEGTLMHEIGHTLGLRHGGNQDYNCKPNYLSVMSYTFQFKANADSNRPLNYSTNAANPLDENSLSETTPITPSYNYPGTNNPRLVFYSSSTGTKLQSTLGTNINWNGGTAGQQGVKQNINNISSILGCSNSAYTTSLTGFDDWSALNFDIFAANSGGTGAPSGDEVTPEEDIEIENMEGPGPDSMTISNSKTYQIYPQGNVIVQSLSDENQQNELKKKDLVDPLLYGKEKTGFVYRYTSGPEIDYKTVQHFYDLHILDVGNKIDALDDTDFKNGKQDRILLEKYLFDAFSANQKNDLAGISENLAKIKYVASNSIISDKKYADFQEVIDDKINSFEIAQDTGGRNPPSDEHKKIFDSLRQLTDSVTELNNSIDQLKVDSGKDVEDLKNDVKILNNTASNLSDKTDELSGKIDNVDRKLSGFMDNNSLVYLVLIIIGLTIAILIIVLLSRPKDGLRGGMIRGDGSNSSTDQILRDLKRVLDNAYEARGKSN